MRKTVLFLMLIALVGSFGCAPKVPVSPAVQFQQKLLSAADAVDVIANGLVAVNATVDTLNNGGQLTAVEVAAVKQWTKSVAQKNDVAISALRAAASGSAAADWKSALLDVVGVVNGVDAAKLGIKNPSAVQAFNAAIATVDAAAGALAVALK